MCIFLNLNYYATYYNAYRNAKFIIINYLHIKYVLYCIHCTFNCSNLQIKLNEPGEKYAEIEFYISLEIREFLQTSSCETFPESVRVRQIAAQTGGKCINSANFFQTKVANFFDPFHPDFLWIKSLKLAHKMLKGGHWFTV